MVTRHRGIHGFGFHRGFRLLYIVPHDSGLDAFVLSRADRLLCILVYYRLVVVFCTQVSRQRKDVFRLEQEREKLGSELSEAQNMYMQSLEDVKVGWLIGRSFRRLIGWLMVWLVFC